MRGDPAGYKSRSWTFYFNSRPCVRGDIFGGEGKLPVVFQFTPLREGRPAMPLSCPAPSSFQFTPLREGRLLCPAGRRQPQDFNSRPCVRGDADLKEYQAAVEKFQFTPLREGRQFRRKLRWCAGLFQFTPLREGRPVGASLFLCHIEFQFTPLREGRPMRAKRAACWGFYFNSRPCVRGDSTGNR